MTPLLAVIGILTVFIVLATLVARVDGLAFLAPRSTRALRVSAQSFCSERCREAGQCPLTKSADAAADCPLFKYIGADVPTTTYGSPFETQSV